MRLLLDRSEIRGVLSVLVRRTPTPSASPGLGLGTAILIVALDMALAAVLVRVLESQDLLVGVLLMVVVDTARLLVIGVLVYWLIARRGLPAEALGLRLAGLRGDLCWALRFVVTSVVVAAILGAVATTALLLASERLPTPPPALTDLVSGGLSPEAVLVFGALAFLGCVSAPLLEETVYRGMLLPPLLRRLPPGAAIAIGAAVFGFLHAVPYAHGGLGMLQFFGGLVMGVAFAARRSTPAVMIVHAAGNAMLAGAYLLQVELLEWCPALFG